MTEIDISKERKDDYEISRYEGKIFCYNHLFFSSIAIPQKFFTFYLKKTPDHYWLGVSFKASFQEGERLYNEYINHPYLLKDRFYQYKDNCRACFEKLISEDKIDSTLYRFFTESIANFGQVASFNLEGLEKVLEDKIASLVPNSNSREAITFPLYTSYAQKQNESLIELIKNLNQYDISLLKRGEKKISNYKELPSLLEEHLAKWGWSLTNYNSEYVPTLYEFLESVITTCCNLQKENEIIKENIHKRKQKENILSNFLLEIKNIIRLLDVIIELRDQRKAFWLKISLDLKWWFRKISPHYSLKSDDLMWLTWQEQCRLSEDKRDYFLKIIKKRKNDCAVLYGYQGGKSVVLTGQEALKLTNFFLHQEKKRELVGTAACSGQVIGKIRNINSSKDFNTFLEGEILAASHTTPDYAPIMRKAKAILTERGGITSHAAIVSRELKVPCIVGIKGLFNNFEDGEKVEVNADQGMVKSVDC